MVDTSIAQADPSIGPVERTKFLQNAAKTVAGEPPRSTARGRRCATQRSADALGPERGVEPLDELRRHQIELLRPDRRAAGDRQRPAALGDRRRLAGDHRADGRPDALHLGRAASPARGGRRAPRAPSAERPRSARRLMPRPPPASTRAVGDRRAARRRGRVGARARGRGRSS